MWILLFSACSGGSGLWWLVSLTHTPTLGICALYLTLLSAGIGLLHYFTPNFFQFSLSLLLFELISCLFHAITNAQESLQKRPCNKEVKKSWLQLAKWLSAVSVNGGGTKGEESSQPEHAESNYLHWSFTCKLQTDQSCLKAWKSVITNTCNNRFFNLC